MATQFTMRDAPSRPQAVSIQWERLTPEDDCGDTPEERDEGFYPTREDCDTEEAFEEAMEAAHERKRAWMRGDWTFIGVQAQATVWVPAGGQSFTTYVMTSPGLWGIEGDCGEEYLEEVYEEQKAELLRDLRTMGAALIREAA